MGAIHELREEYRFYRAENPGYRWLFLLVDLASFLIKLALFGGFVFLCWYLLSRSPYAEETGFVGSNQETAPATQAIAADLTPELTDERLERLREIAAQEDAESSQPALVGNVTVDTDKSSSSFVVTTFGENLDEPTVQVESVPSNEQIARQAEVSFTENVFIPASTENGNWVLNQHASDHTIQLALTVNVKFLVDFARELPAEYAAAIYPEKVNSKGDIQYSLSLGSFPSKLGAEAVLENLDENLKRYGAHTRVFDEVQSSINGFVL